MYIGSSDTILNSSFIQQIIKSYRLQLVKYHNTEKCTVKFTLTRNPWDQDCHGLSELSDKTIKVYSNKLLNAALGRKLIQVDNKCPLRHI